MKKLLLLLSLLLTVSSAQADEMDCLVEALYHEARSEEIVPMIAVGNVIMERVRSERFPNTVCEVVHQAKYYPSGRIDLHSCQFSWYCDGKSDAVRNQKAWDESMYSALFVYTSDPLLDVVDGALWYHATYTSPEWAKHFQKTVQINEHIFYKEREQ